MVSLDIQDCWNNTLGIKWFYRVLMFLFIKTCLFLQRNRMVLYRIAGLKYVWCSHRFFRFVVCYKEQICAIISKIRWDIKRKELISPHNKDRIITYKLFWNCWRVLSGSKPSNFHDLIVNSPLWLLHGPTHFLVHKLPDFGVKLN